MLDVSKVVSFLRSTFSRKDVVIIVILILLFLFTRLIRLDDMPIFSDEGIYIRWAKVAWKDASWRFISLTDGRQPLQTWGIIPFLKIFPYNPLLAGRLFSVASGLFALVGIFSSAFYLFNKKTAYISALLYIITPYFLFYDRMTLADSAVNGFVIWIFFFSVLMARTLRLDVAILLGLLSGFGLLAKSSVKVYVGLMALAPVFLLFSHKEGGLKNMLLSLKNKFVGKDNKINSLVSFITLYFIVISLYALIYNVQRLSPFFHYVAEKNKTFILTVPELLQNPFAYFPHNIVNLPYYVFSEMGYIVAVLGIVGLYFLYKKDRILAIYLGLWLITITILLSFFAKVLFPRYVLPLGGLLLIPASYLLSNIKNSRNFMGILVVIIVSILYFDYTIIFNYPRIPFPEIDRGQYVEGRTAVWGAREIVDFAREKSKEKQVILIAEGNFGLIGDVLETFKLPNDAISVNGYWPLDKENLIENQSNLNDSYVYVVFSHREEFPLDWPIKLIKRYEKPGRKASVYLFELTK